MSVCESAVSDEGLSALVKSAQHSLQHLTLAGSRVARGSGNALASLHTCQQLLTLDLSFVDLFNWQPVLAQFCPLLQSLDCRKLHCLVVDLHDCRNLVKAVVSGAAADHRNVHESTSRGRGPVANSPDEYHSLTHSRIESDTSLAERGTSFFAEDANSALRC